MNLRESKLRDPALLDEFYENILTSYDCAENYYIVLIHAVYGTDIYYCHKCGKAFDWRD